MYQNNTIKYLRNLRNKLKGQKVLCPCPHCPFVPINVNIKSRQKVLSQNPTETIVMSMQL